MATILIVDDYVPNHRLMSFVLEQNGYTVVAAYDGQQALDRLATTNIDLIVTDLTMPRIDGLLLARMVRSDPRIHALPIILVTASSKEQDHVRAAGVGVDTFLTKPVESEELVREVDRLITSTADRQLLQQVLSHQRSIV